MTTVVGPPPHWSLLANPYYLAFAPYSAPGRVDFWDYLGFFAAALGASAVLAVLAVWRMRPVARRGTDESRKGPRLGLSAGSRDGCPARRSTAIPCSGASGIGRGRRAGLMILVVLVGGSTGVACVVGAVMLWRNGLDARLGCDPWGWWLGIYGLDLQVIFGLLMLSAAAPTSMSEERQRGSLDLLAATTLSTPTIVLGKWLGTLRLVALLAIGPGLWDSPWPLAFKAPPTIPPGSSRRPGTTRRIVRGASCSSGPVSWSRRSSSTAPDRERRPGAGVWIKRQSRAIAMSVGFAVMLGAGWPILVVAMPHGSGQDRAWRA